MKDEYEDEERRSDMNPEQNMTPDRANEPERVARPLATVMAIAAGLLRLVPHPWNFTPVGGLALFSGGRLPSWQAFAIPLAVMAGSDVALAFMNGFDRSWYLLSPIVPFVYGSFLVNVLLGKLLCRTQSAVRIGSASLLASLQFFLVTNFAQWLFNSFAPGTYTHLLAGQYPRSLAGLGECYLAGLPFFGTTLIGDLAYSGLLFGAYALLTHPRFSSERSEAVAETK
jgi:hypothetical protein